MRIVGPVLPAQLPYPMRYTFETAGITGPLWYVMRLLVWRDVLLRMVPIFLPVGAAGFASPITWPTSPGSVSAGSPHPTRAAATAITANVGRRRIHCSCT